MKKESSEFESFDKVMDGLLSVPYSELQKKLEVERRIKEKKKKRSTSTASSVRASSSRKRRAV